MKMLIFPEMRQTFEYDCGAKALQEVLAYYGKDISEERVIKFLKTTKKNGTSIKKILQAIKEYSLKYKEGKMTLKEVKSYINKKIPVLLLVQAWAGRKKVNWRKDWKDGHYVIAIGYDSNKIFFEDPASIYRTYLANKELEKRWHGKASHAGKLRYFNYGIAIYGKKPNFKFNEKIHMG